MKQLVHIRRLRFCKKVAEMPTTRLTRQMINSVAIPKPGTQLTGGGHKSTKRSWQASLEDAQLVNQKEGAPLKEWMQQLTQPDIGTKIEKALGLPEKTFTSRRPKKRR